MTWPLVSAHQLTIMFYCSPKHLEIKTFLIKIQRAYYFKLKFKREIRKILLHFCMRACTSSTSDPSVKVNLTWSLTASTLLHQLFLLSVCFIYLMLGRYSTNWDRKCWPSSEIQMCFGCPWHLGLIQMCFGCPWHFGLHIRSIRMSRTGKFCIQYAKNAPLDRRRSSNIRDITGVIL